MTKYLYLFIVFHGLIQSLQSRYDCFLTCPFQYIIYYCKIWEIWVPHNGVEDLGLLVCYMVLLIGSSKHREPLGRNSIISQKVWILILQNGTFQYELLMVSWNIHSFIRLACVECDDSLPFSGASFIALCYVPFPSTIFHQPVFPSPSLHLAIYFLVCLSVLLFPNSYIIPFFFVILFSSTLCTCTNQRNLFNHIVMKYTTK